MAILANIRSISLNEIQHLKTLYGTYPNIELFPITLDSLLIEEYKFSAIKTPIIKDVCSKIENEVTLIETDMDITINAESAFSISDYFFESELNKNKNNKLLGRDSTNRQEKGQKISKKYNKFKKLFKAKTSKNNEIDDIFGNI